MARRYWYMVYFDFENEFGKGKGRRAFSSKRRLTMADVNYINDLLGEGYSFLMIHDIKRMPI